MSKGAHATTAIEGNTLTEEEVSRMLDGRLDLPPSRRYLEQEVRNVLDAFRSIDESIRTSGDLTLTPEIVGGYNELVLRDIGRGSEIRPGRIRTSEIVVGRYRGPRAKDCDHLLERLCDWLLCSDFEMDEDDPLAFARALTRALLAHLYIAWIHPFGDGNGRTARLVEYHLLAGSGLVPNPTVHLLSNYYNQTRSRYYRVLDRSSRTRPWSPVEFIAYASGGFVDGLEEQICLDQGSTLLAGMAELCRRGDAPLRHGRRPPPTRTSARPASLRSQASIRNQAAHTATSGGLRGKDL